MTFSVLGLRCLACSAIFCIQSINLKNYNHYNSTIKQVWCTALLPFLIGLLFCPGVSLLFQVFHMFQPDAILTKPLSCKSIRMLFRVYKFCGGLLRNRNTTARVHIRYFTISSISPTGTTSKVYNYFIQFKLWPIDCMVKSETGVSGWRPTSFL